MKYKAVIFDLDGTLLDTLEDLADSFNYALKMHHFPLHSSSACRMFVGDGARTAVERALPPEARDDKTIDKVLAEFSKHYAQNYNNKTKPYPGIITLLEALKSTGINLVVLSNKPHEFTLQCMNAYFKNIFILVQGVETRFNKKPAPESSHNILERLKLSAEEALFVGDTRTDIQTAKNAGLKSVGVTWGFRERKELQQAGADFIIDRPEELLTL